MSAETEYSAKEVAAHREKADAWMVINGDGKGTTPIAAM